MKFLTIFLAGITSATETDDAAIVSLDKLMKISVEILYSPSITKGERWRYIRTRKMEQNYGRLRRSFRRCGTKYGGADDEIDVEYDIDNPCGAIMELLNGYLSLIHI